MYQPRFQSHALAIVRLPRPLFVNNYFSRLADFVAGARGLRSAELDSEYVRCVCGEGSEGHIEVLKAQEEK